MQYVEPAVSIADASIRSETRAFFVPFFLFFSVEPGLPPRPAQGLTPSLLPKQGVSPLDPFPLARFPGMGL
ncbi:MAG: hypothetical protein ACI4ML_00560 [Aristaeellaceae bacterium]